MQNPQPNTEKVNKKKKLGGEDARAVRGFRFLFNTRAIKMKHSFPFLRPHSAVAAASVSVVSKRFNGPTRSHIQRKYKQKRKNPVCGFITMPIRRIVFVPCKVLECMCAILHNIRFHAHTNVTSICNHFNGFFIDHFSH